MGTANCDASAASILCLQAISSCRLNSQAPPPSSTCLRRPYFPSEILTDRAYPDEVVACVR
ncbi:hypothetical protein M6B38_145405 [Iris pallida]|uniref:Uncharacterized protein n=1 Tax=Iris pallida TaxID=29817 RepID=A0AAX6FAX8_IRIPA|nr:hypothetical protein M6B38_145405 [Iris pallida]